MKDHACETYQTMQHPQRPYGLLGKTLKHSFSPQLHAAIGAALGTSYPYILFEKQPGGAGCIPAGRQLGRTKCDDSV